MADFLDGLVADNDRALKKMARYASRFDEKADDYFSSEPFPPGATRNLHQSIAYFRHQYTILARKIKAQARTIRTLRQKNKELRCLLDETY